MSLSRHFDTTSAVSSLPQADPSHELLQSLTRINAYNPPVHTCSTGWSPSGIYKGPTSIAYLFFKISQHYPELTFKSQTLLEWAEDYLKLSPCASSANSIGEDIDPSRCGIANETLAFLAVGSLITSDVSLVRRLCAFENIINASGPQNDGSNEWLYGRAGYLYFLRMCRSHSQFPNPASLTKVLDQKIARTVDRITQIPLPWTWHGKQYLGAAHGYIGTVAQIMLSLGAMESPPRDQPLGQKLESLVADLLNTQFDSGNFPSSVDTLGDSPTGTDRLVQFCHGGPGFATSLACIQSHFSAEMRERIGQALEKVREDTWKRGFLTKPPSLCHGIAGNAFAFTAKDDDRFNQCLAGMTTKQMEALAQPQPQLGFEKGWMEDAGRSDAFAGLFTGEAGRAWSWAVADKGLERRIIGFNDV